MEMHFYELSTAMFKIEKSEFKKLVKFGVRQGKPYIKKDEKSLIKLLCELSVTYVPTGEKMYLGNEDIKRMVISLMNQEQLNKLFEECQS